VLVAASVATAARVRGTRKPDRLQTVNSVHDVVTCGGGYDLAGILGRRIFWIEFNDPFQRAFGSVKVARLSDVHVRQQVQIMHYLLHRLARVPNNLFDLIGGKIDALLVLRV